MARNVFYSFHYKPDVTRVAKIRNIGAIEGNKPAPDNSWESIKDTGDYAIKNWIASQMRGRSCTLVLAGSQTAGRKWITHEVSESWNNGMGVAVIYIHGIKDLAGATTAKGNNPMDSVTFSGNGKMLSTIARAYTPVGSSSQERYNWIARNIGAIVDEAVRIRKQA